MLGLETVVGGCLKLGGCILKLGGCMWGVGTGGGPGPVLWLGAVGVRPVELVYSSSSAVLVCCFAAVLGCCGGAAGLLLCCSCCSVAVGWILYQLPGRPGGPGLKLGGPARLETWWSWCIRPRPLCCSAALHALKLCCSCSDALML